MFTVRIEHPISDLPTWQAAFDRDPVDRAGLGVRRYVIHQPVEDPQYVHIDLDVETEQEAQTFLDRMDEVWANASAAPALRGRPVTKILTVVQSAEVARV